MDKELIADIQEVTVACVENDIYSRIFEDGSMSRDEIMELFAKWGREFHESHKDFIWDGSASYYDEIDVFVAKKFKEYSNPYIDRLGNPYHVGTSLPAGGGLHKDCDYNAEALYAYYVIKNKRDIAWYLANKGFVVLTVTPDMEEWMKGDTKIEFSSCCIDGTWGYVHTEPI